MLLVVCVLQLVAVLRFLGLELGVVWVLYVVLGSLFGCGVV